MDILDVAWSSDLTFAECEHKKQVGVNARFVNESVLNQESLKDLSASGCHKLHKDKRVEECISLQYNAVNQRAHWSFPARTENVLFISQCMSRKFTITPGLGELLLHAT